MIPPFTAVPSLSYGEQPSKNMLIEGDNCLVMSQLSTESIDLVLTDPPYGTEKQFRYNDRWRDSVPDSLDEVYVTQREAGTHAGWLNFMACRLQLMKRLLKHKGIIAVSIGKENLFYLGVLMDDLFGEHNRIGILCWQKRYSPSNDSKHISDATDYVLIYAKRRSEEQGQWESEKPCFDLNRLKIGDVPLCSFPSPWYEHQFELGSQSWKHQQSGHNQDATRLLNAIMGGGHQNATPKPLKLLSKILQLWCPPDGTVLDVFAGSGSTGHAVLDVNAQVHAERRFILVEQGNGATNDYFARTLTAERLRRVLSGEWATGLHAPLPGGFTFYSTKENWHSEVQA